MASSTGRRAPVVSAPSQGRGQGHFLQPEWTGNDSLLDRFEAVRPLVTGGSVLDIGCASRFGRPDWLHGLLAAEVPDLVGIDINEVTLAKVAAEGYDVRVGDARAFDLGRRFDVVFAGELIEHLDDVGGFLRSARRHLAPRGRLVLTTPNAFYVGNFVYRVGGQAQVHPEHTCWFCEDTLRRVLDMNGFTDVVITYTGHESPTRLRSAVTWTARHALPARLAFDTIIVVASAADDAT